MRRFLALSILLHVLVFVSFINRRAEVIDNPIVAVSLDLSEPRIAKRVAQPATAATLNKTAVPENVTAENSSSETSSENSQTKNSTAAYESGNVSVKPKVTRQIQVAYPQQAKDAGIVGVVKLSVLVNELGRVSEVTVLDGPGHGLNEAAREALQQFLFSPAEVEGRKVPVRITYLYRFQLDSR